MHDHVVANRGRLNKQKSFCESRGSASGDDVVFLPAIVEAAVASPAAATECARLIRKFMGRDYWTKPSYQYNAIMLIRILCDNPGPNFTRNMDKKFVDTTKELLRSGRDVSVRQMLMETLDTFENTRGYDEGLDMIIDMWKKEKEKAYKAYGVSSFLFYPSKNFADFGVKLPKLGAVAQVLKFLEKRRNGKLNEHTGFLQGQSNARTAYVPPFQGQFQQGPYQQGAYQQGPYQPQPDQHGHGSYHRSRSGGNRLPDPIELANRLEEARTSASLLEQVVANTPPSEVLSNDLIKEFADRCSGASKSIR